MLFSTTQYTKLQSNIIRSTPCSFTTITLTHHITKLRKVSLMSKISTTAIVGLLFVIVPTFHDSHTQFSSSHVSSFNQSRICIGTNDNTASALCFSFFLRYQYHTGLLAILCSLPWLYNFAIVRCDSYVLVVDTPSFHGVVNVSVLRNIGKIKCAG